HGEVWSEVDRCGYSTKSWQVVKRGGGRTASRSFPVASTRDRHTWPRIRNFPVRHLIAHLIGVLQIHYSQVRTDRRRWPPRLRVVFQGNYRPAADQLEERLR